MLEHPLITRGMAETELGVALGAERYFLGLAGAGIISDNYGRVIEKPESWKEIASGGFGGNLIKSGTKSLKVFRMHQNFCPLEGH